MAKFYVTAVYAQDVEVEDRTEYRKICIYYRIEAKSIKDAVQRLHKYRSTHSGLPLFIYGIFTSKSERRRKGKPLYAWMSKKANRRLYGIKCPYCGGETKLVERNWLFDKVLSIFTDLHVCSECGEKILVDMSDC